MGIMASQSTDKSFVQQIVQSEHQISASLVTGGILPQRDSNAETVSMTSWWNIQDVSDGYRGIIEWVLMSSKYSWIFRITMRHSILGKIIALAVSCLPFWRARCVSPVSMSGFNGAWRSLEGGVKFYGFLNSFEPVV